VYSPHVPGTSEARLGAVEAGKRFVVDTKIASFLTGSHSRAKIEESIESSLISLKIETANIAYLHLPERTTPFDETIEAMNEAFKACRFKRLGLSNYPAAEVKKIVEICREKGYVKPSFYQGQYNPIVRSGEKELFPVLRKHEIVFCAWRFANHF
jgi:aflatoxin B1 aldehyde reductase